MGMDGISRLDEAYNKRLGGDPAEALRICTALVESGRGQVGAALLSSWILTDECRTMTAGEVAVELSRGYIRRGDLPLASVAMSVAAAANEDVTALRADVAQTFGRGSSRVADVPPAPPPLPLDAPTPAALAALSGEALYQRAEKALEVFLGTPDPITEDGDVPELPLFSALKPGSLNALLGLLTVREVAAGETLIAAGDEGHEAFVLARGALRVSREVDGQERVLALLGPGALFGEMALVSDSPRAANVIAEEAAVVLSVDRAALEKLARVETAIGKELAVFCRGRMVANLLRHSAILSAVEPAHRESLMAVFETRQFKAGEHLITHGEESEGLFLIATGHVDVVGRDSDGDKLKLGRQLGPGDVVGEISLVLRRPANADVVASHPTVALELRREQFNELIQSHPTLLGELYELATRRDDEMRSVVAQEALDATDVVLL